MEIVYGQDELRSHKYNFAESCIILDCSFCGICHSLLFMMNFKSETAIILTTGTVVEATELESLKRNTTADGEIGLMTLPTRRSSKQNEPTLTTYGRSCADRLIDIRSCLNIFTFLRTSFAIDQRTWTAGLPVRSVVLKPCAGRLVVGWVTTSEYLLLIVLEFLQSQWTTTNHY